MGIEKNPRFPKNLFKIEDGRSIHRRIQRDLLLAGILIAKEFNIEDAENHIRGSADGKILLEERKRLLEIKTINDDKFNSLYGGPTVDNYKQANFYAINCGLEDIFFYYYNTNNGKTKEFEVKTNIEVYKSSIIMVQMIRRCIEEQVVPNETVQTYCFACDYQYLCFSKKVNDKRKLVI